MLLPTLIVHLSLWPAPGASLAAGQLEAPGSYTLAARLDPTLPLLLFTGWNWRPPTLAVVQRDHAPQPLELIGAAREFLGIPYVWGGNYNPGLDCSGFVNKVYALHGYDIPRTARQQYKIGLKVGRDQLQPGDLVFFFKHPEQTKPEEISHVGLYNGDDEIIHAAMGKGEVTYDRLTSRYYSARFFTGRRLLVLPPGRYTQPHGAAIEGAAFERPEELASYVMPELTGPAPGGQGTGPAPGPGPGPGPGLQPGHSQQQLLEEFTVEHRPEDAQAQLSQRGFVKGAVTEVGPALLAPQATSIDLRLGVGGLGGTAYLLAVPQFSWFGHDDALQAVLAAPFQVPLQGGVPSASEQIRAGYDSAADWSKLLRLLRYGQKEADLYVELGRTSSGTLGHGQLMRYYTPNVASRWLPQYGIAADHLSLSLDGVLPWGAGGELFVDDVIAPRVLGALAYVRPAMLAGGDGELARRLSLGLTYVIDADAPWRLEPGVAAGDPWRVASRRAVHGLGLDLEFKALRTEALDLKLYLDGSGLLREDGSGFGGAVGALLRANLVGRQIHVLRLRAEARLSGPAFVPSYFDTTYRLHRLVAPVDAPADPPLTKLGLLSALAGGPARWGVYAEAGYQLHRRLQAGLAYEDGGATSDLPAATSFTGRNLMLYLAARNLYLPGSSKALNLYLAYHLRNFSEAWPLLSTRRTNEYLFAAASVQVLRYLVLGASLRKALDPEAASNRAAYDGVLDVQFSYEL